MRATIKMNPQYLDSENTSKRVDDPIQLHQTVVILKDKTSTFSHVKPHTHQLNPLVTELIVFVNSAAATLLQPL